MAACLFNHLKRKSSSRSQTSSTLKLVANRCPTSSIAAAHCQGFKNEVCASTWLKFQLATNAVRQRPISGGSLFKTQLAAGASSER